MKHVLIIAIMIFSSVVNAQVVTIEAENMSIKQCANGKATTDGWTCLGPGKIAENVTFKDGIIDMQVIARGDYAGGAWPIMDVSIGGTVIAAITVDSATWKTFNIEKVTTSAGVHELALTFTNDYYESGDLVRTRSAATKTTGAGITGTIITKTVVTRAIVARRKIFEARCAAANSWAKDREDRCTGREQVCSIDT